MSATLKGFSFSQVKPQPGFTATRQENGGYIGRHSFAISRAAWESGAANQFSKGQPITSFDDSLPFSWNFLKIVETEIVSEEGDIVMIAVTLSGAQGASYGEDDEAPDPTYRLSGQLQDAPLSMHPKWEALEDIEKAALGYLIRGELVYDEPTNGVGTRDERTFWIESDSSGAELELTSEDGIAFAKLIARGETTYSRPVITWTESAQGTDGLTNAQLNKLGNISTPRGDPPEASGTRDWMLTSAFQEQRGDLFTTDLEWTLSEKGGHDAYLYEE
jgi:hypothetical protein